MLIDILCLAPVQIVQLSAQKSLGVVETKIELDLHANTCVVGGRCLEEYDLKRPVNVYRYDPKVHQTVLM